MNKERGFTLIELLAVIIILAVVALIAVPVTLNIISNTKKSSAKSSVINYVDGLKKELQKDFFETEEELEGTYRILEDGSYEINGKVKKLNVKGKLPSKGKVCVGENGTIRGYSIFLDGYVVSKFNGDVKIDSNEDELNIICDLKDEKVEFKKVENLEICTMNKTVELEDLGFNGIIRQYSLDQGKNWSEYKEPIVIEKNGLIMARLSDGEKTSSIEELMIKNIDLETVSTTSPNLVLSSENLTSKIIATIRQEDDCGIDEDTIEYGISETKDGEYSYQLGNVFSNLKENTTYYIRTRANDIVGRKLVESEISEIKTEEIPAPTITTTDGWAQSKVVTATYYDTNLTNPIYYIKGTVSGILDTNVTESCGTDTKPNECTTITGTTSLNANTWYKVTGPTVKLTVTENGSFYAITSDGTNLKQGSTLTITTIDTTGPSCGSWSGTSTSWATSRTITLGCSDSGSGCAKTSYTKTYSTTTKTATPSIEIADALGNKTTCKPSSALNIYVDTTGPSCGSWSGTSTTWAKSRTIKLGCSDSHSGCAKTSYSKTYSTTTKTATPSIEIADALGNKTTCKPSSALNIYVDTTAPTCGPFNYMSQNSTAYICGKDSSSGVLSIYSGYTVTKYSSLTINDSVSWMGWGYASTAGGGNISFIDKSALSFLNSYDYCIAWTGIKTGTVAYQVYDSAGNSCSGSFNN